MGEHMRVLNRLVVAAVFVSCVLLVPMSATQLPTPQIKIETAKAPMDVLYAHPSNERFTYGPQGDELERLLSADRPQTATITVTYTGFSPEAQAAFQNAVNIWQTVLTSPIPIRVQANWTPLGAGVLGSAGASGLCSISASPPPGMQINTFYGAALFDKLYGTQICASVNSATVEITASFNSTFTDWDFGTAPVSGKYNFMTVVL